MCLECNSKNRFIRRKRLVNFSRLHVEKYKIMLIVNMHFLLRNHLGIKHECIFRINFFQALCKTLPSVLEFRHVY